MNKLCPICNQPMTTRSLFPSNQSDWQCKECHLEYDTSAQALSLNWSRYPLATKVQLVDAGLAGRIYELPGTFEETSQKLLQLPWVKLLRESDRS